MPWLSYINSEFIYQATLWMASCGLILERAENSIVSKNKCLEDLRNKNKALQAQVDELDEAHTSALFILSKILEEKNNLEVTLFNQEESIQALTSSLASAKEVQKQDEEIVALLDTYIDKFTECANHIKKVLFQDFKEDNT